MDKIYMISIGVGIVLIAVIAIFLFSMPFGKIYSNAVFIKVPASHFINTGLNGSYVINVTNFPTVFLFHQQYVSFFTIPLNASFIKLIPLNQSYYKLVYNDTTFVIPIESHNLTIEASNSKITFLNYNNSTSYVYLVNLTTSGIGSLYSTKNSSLFIFNSSILPSYPISISYLPQKAEYYQNISIECTSRAKYMNIKTNTGVNKTFPNGSGSIITMAVPGLSVTCYNGYNYITKQFNFSKASPILTLTYENGIATCNSTFDWIVYLYLNNNLVKMGDKSVSYNVSIKPPFILKCETPGTPYQLPANKTLSVS